MEDYPRTLMKFERRFATDQACREYLFALRWLEGFVRPRCGGRQAWAARDKLFYRLLQQATQVEPHPYQTIVHPHR